MSEDKKQKVIDFAVKFGVKFLAGAACSVFLVALGTALGASGMVTLGTLVAAFTVGMLFFDLLDF